MNKGASKSDKSSWLDLRELKTSDFQQMLNKLEGKWTLNFLTMMTMYNGDDGKDNANNENYDNNNEVNNDED